MKVLPSLAFIMLALPSVVQAQEATDTPIIVTGSGLEDTPATPAYDVQILSGERLTSSASGRIEDVLSAVAGFQQFRRSDSRSANPSAQGVTLRALGGNATSRSLVLLDGVPMTEPFFGFVPLSALSPERLASVRVTRGGGSGAFGAGAVAGTIEMTSAGPDQLGLLNGSVLTNDRGDSEFSASLAPRLGEGFAVISARTERGQGFWTTPAAQRSVSSVRARYNGWSTSLRAVAPLTATIELQAGTLLFEDQRTLRFAGADSASNGQDASLRLVGRGEWKFELLSYVQARDFSNVVINGTNFRKSLDQRHTPSTGFGGKLELRPPVHDAHVLRLGADLRNSSGNLQEDAYSGVTGLVVARRSAGGRNRDIGLFVEDDWTEGDVVLTAGFRADHWTVRQGYFREASTSGTTTIDNRFADRSGWDTSLRGGAVWQTGVGLKLRAAAYSGLRLPTLNELYRPFVVFPVATRANAALKNEKLRGFEAGLNFTLSDTLTLSLTAFDNQVKHAIANVTVATNLRERRNVDAVRAKGVELTAGLRVGRLTFDGSLALTDSVVKARGVSAALDGMRPAQTPRIATSATLGWLPQQGWLFFATVRHVGVQYEDDLQIDVLPAATILDAYAQLPLAGPVSIVVRIENLGDTMIVTRNQAGSIDLGAPRTFWTGIKFSFGQ